MAAPTANWIFRAVDIWYTIHLTKGRRPAPAAPAPAWGGPQQATAWLGRDAVAKRKGSRWISSLNLKFMGYVRSVRAVIGHMRQRGEGAIALVVGNDGLKPSYWEPASSTAPTYRSTGRSVKRSWTSEGGSP